MLPAFSNIAWQPDEDLAAYDLLSSLGFGHLEVAPGRLWTQPASVSESEMESSLVPLRAKGLAVCGFQAILFGKPELTLFETSEARAQLLEYLGGLIQTCASSGGSYLVFGAPKNRRVAPGQSAEETDEIAVSFFRDLGALASTRGVCVGIEANPEEYGCNFCTHAADVTRLVRKVDSPGIRWHLDTGELIMNSEPVPSVILENADVIGSVHTSEPQLAALDAPWDGHKTVARALAEAGYQGTISVEMKRASDGLAAVKRAADFVLQTYFSQ